MGHTADTLPSIARMLRVDESQRDALPELDLPVCGKKVDEDFDWHCAIVYEFVSRASQDIVVGQAHLDFFYAIGFALEPYKPDNWQGGRLINFNDLCSPHHLARTWRGLQFTAAKQKNGSGLESVLKVAPKVVTYGLSDPG